MLAAYALTTSPDNPLAGLRIGDQPAAHAPDDHPDWSVVDVRAASLNHHDVWSLRGVGLPADRLPMILGTDAAGVTADGTEVVIHAVIGATGHGVGPRERRSLLSERFPGTLAEQVAVPTWNLVPKPAELSFEEVACLPTAWLTAYRMLFRSANVRPGDRVLVQGAGGGVATAAVLLGAAAGLEMVATSRDAAKRERARGLGAAHAIEPGARLPFRVDAVLETVGRATWSHSVRSLRPGGTIVVAGATSGDQPGAELTRIFFTELSVVGATMGSKEDFEGLLRFLVRTGIRPVIDRAFPLRHTADAMARMVNGEHFGKIVLTM